MTVTQTSTIFFAPYTIGQVSYEELLATSIAAPSYVYKVAAASQFPVRIYPQCDDIQIEAIELFDMDIIANSATPIT